MPESVIWWHAHTPYPSRIYLCTHIPTIHTHTHTQAKQSKVPRCLNKVTLPGCLFTKQAQWASVCNTHTHIHTCTSDTAQHSSLKFPVMSNVVSASKVPFTVHSRIWFLVQDTMLPWEQQMVEEMLTKYMSEHPQNGSLSTPLAMSPLTISPCTLLAQYAVIRTTMMTDLHSVGWWLLW